MRSFLKTPAFIIPTSTAVLYLIGKQYYLGYLKVLCLEESQFPITFDSTLFYGFFSSSSIGAPFLNQLFFAACATAILIVIVNFIIFIYKRFIRSRITADAVGNSKPSEKFQLFSNSLEELSYKIMFSLGIILIFFVYFIVLLQQAATAGSKNAETYMEKVDAGEYKMNAITLKGQPKPYITHTIACNSSECAYYTNSEVRIVRKSEILRQTISISK